METTEKKPRKAGSGGARPGAGRKAISGVRRESLTLTVTPETRAKLDRLAADQGISLSELINRLAATL
ncbi:MAG: ribbon-helix-helix protein, CopG family [Bacteroidales bacterium]|nr:ribbon-helix-helix protein, CopG family [Bacteroidales bacterium]